MKELVRGLLNNNDVKAFILAGKALFSVENSVTKNHLTFKVEKKEYSKEEKEHAEDTGYRLPEIYFVKYCTQCEVFSYLGLIRDGEFSATKNSPSVESTSFKGFEYIFNHYIKSNDHDSRLEFYHEGRCAYCGRIMTDPDSVKRGFGPTCYQRAKERLV